MPDPYDYPMAADETPPGRATGPRPTGTATTPPPDDFAALLTEWYHQFLGPDRNPTPEEIAVHRGNPGGLDGVYGTIARSAEAKAYAKAQAEAAAEAAAGKKDPAATDPTGNAGRQRAESYYKSKNVTPFPTSLDYWGQKWDQWGSKDPAYFDTRLATADEFTGVGPNYNWQAAGIKDPGTSASGAPPPPATPPATPPVNPFTVGGASLLDLAKPVVDPGGRGLAAAAAPIPVRPPVGGLTLADLARLARSK